VHIIKFKLERYINYHVLFCVEAVLYLKMSNYELLTDQGLRLDGRRPRELRTIKCRMGVFEQPDGSAYIEQGNTKVLAAVYGPHQPTTKKMDIRHMVINCQYSMTNFATAERRSKSRGDRKSMEFDLFLEQAVQSSVKTELYPRSQLDVYIEVLEADGSNLGVALNAATLALVDAGIYLKEYIVACTAALSTKNIPLTDTSHVEETSGAPTLTLASLPCTNKVAFIEMSHKFHMEHLIPMIEQAMDGCRDIRKVLERCIREHLTRLGSAAEWSNIAKRI